MTIEASLVLALCSTTLLQPHITLLIRTIHLPVTTIGIVATIVSKYWVVATVLAVFGLSASISNAMPSEPAWPPFIMVFEEESLHQLVISRLTWHNRGEWKLEVLQDTFESPRQGLFSPPSGRSFVFSQGTYTVYDATGKVTSVERLDAFMAPAEWLVPGYLNKLKERQGYIVTSIVNSAHLTLERRESRRCVNDPYGNSLDPTCDSSREVVTQVTFDAKTQIPLERIVQVNGQFVYRLRVRELLLQ